jgi:hypothetical protein
MLRGRSASASPLLIPISLDVTIFGTTHFSTEFFASSGLRLNSIQRSFKTALVME